MNTEIDEHCICAAYELRGGLVVVGRRHDNIIKAMHGKIPDWRSSYRDGFLTNEGRFVDRQQGLQLQKMAEIPSKRGYYQQELYSEDLY